MPSSGPGRVRARARAQGVAVRLKPTLRHMAVLAHPDHAAPRRCLPAQLSAVDRREEVALHALRVLVLAAPPSDERRAVRTEGDERRTLDSNWWFATAAQRPSVRSKRAPTELGRPS
eukprot:CAMPEP_0205945062 /NCGR_PEP_ID=MMETSP1325-20131115/65030_1 /ASSEMBLY_ACC=CAM_ASM_000708 /TAXON_ID=236786 /ORGANISM="Florenciella sp., Strain RCC1007" /LENGTH=116 /DNA_ID=CAMNT_0053316021 /DNA_START=259 /DNA_END=608 /DNA_ORIENTATION=-